MGWGSLQNTWHLSLSPKDAETTAYPSFAFRLASAKNVLPVDNFKNVLKQKFVDSFGTTDSLSSLHLCVTDIPVDHTNDIILVTPATDRDSAFIKSAFQKHLPQIKSAFQKSLDRFEKEILSPFKTLPDFAPVSELHIFDLICRLKADILPNIIPDGSLLGKPATFGAILNACALYRIHMLSTRGGAEGPEAISQNLSKVDRLTAKSLEVSYVQHDFNDWINK